MSNAVEKEAEVWVYHRRLAAKIIKVSELGALEQKGWTTKRLVPSTEVEELRNEIRETEAALVTLKKQLEDVLDAEGGYVITKAVKKPNEINK